MFTKRRLDVDEQKIRVVQAVKGLMMFSDEYLYKEYFNLTDNEIKEIKEQLEEQQEEMMQQQMAMGGGLPGQPGQAPVPGPGGPPPSPMSPPAAEMPPQGSVPPNGIEGQENIPPTAPPQESIDLLKLIKSNSINEQNMERAMAFDRIIKKYNAKIKNMPK